MQQIAIRADNLSKRYRLGLTINRRPTLRDAVARALRRGARVKSLEMSAGTAGDFWAVDGVSFEVGVGEVFGIIGPNGAGKSTLLKILAQVIEPTAGKAEILGRVCALLEIGTGFHAELTGRENIFLNGAILGMRRDEIASKLDEIVDFAGVETFLDTPVKRYSSGMYLRLAFAVAAHVEPDILLVDEVLAVGDAAFQKRCIGKVQQVAQSGRTVVFVSHQLSVVRKLCSRAMLVDGGNVITRGATHEVIETYLRSITDRVNEELATRTSRLGRGRVRLTSVEIESDTGVPTSGARTVVQFRASGDRIPVDCSFTIYDDLGEAVTCFDSAVHSDGDLIGGAFRCEFPSLLLRPGLYRINAALTSRDGELQDHVEGAAAFEVQPGLLRGRLVNAQPGYGNVTMPHRWTTLDM